MHIYIFIDIIFIIKKEVLTCVRFFFREVVSTLDVAESAGPSKSWKRVTKARFRWSISSRPLSPEKTTHTTSVKCLWEVFVWGVVLVVYVCVCRCRGCCSLSVCVCVCDLIFTQGPWPLRGLNNFQTSYWLFTFIGCLEQSD